MNGQDKAGISSMIKPFADSFKPVIFALMICFADPKKLGLDSKSFDLCPTRYFCQSQF